MNPWLVWATFICLLAALVISEWIGRDLKRTIERQHEVMERAMRVVHQQNEQIEMQRKLIQEFNLPHLRDGGGPQRPDPREANYHSLHADIWDMREGK